MAGRLVSLLLPVTWIAGMAVGNREITPPPSVIVQSSDALVIVKISVPDTSPYFVLKNYNRTLRRNGSSEENSEFVNANPFIISPNDLLPEQTYCLTVHVCYNGVCESSPIGPEICFMAPAKGPPNNLRMEALDLSYLLKWDWNFTQSPNATFSVERCTYHDGKCTTIKDCENITSTQCYCLGVHFSGESILRVSVYHPQREEKSSNIILFNPTIDILGPPKDLMMRIVGNELDINVSTPEGFKNDEIRCLCDRWTTHLEYWTNSSHSSEDKEEPFFKIKSLEPSTTYCAKAKMQCAGSNRSSQYSEVYCITTDPKSYLFAWIIGFAFLGIVVISVVVYICLFPLKRYIKHKFFPPRRLPSCIEKGFGESSLDCIKHQFLSHEEEPMDRCYVAQDSHTEDLGQMNNKNASKANSQDSGNGSNEGQTSGETISSDANV
ncbi:interferon alpha/beta receptor 1-like isoform X2 [Hyla sarda]|uniref:interferon alpha/beta receptor 1-like isoform X2 n=1 Tax=Hyla sarda TaxID=327740 RepID=UPI0024C40A7F|nr:interferon alpha/beta receptor 1-like isoform X2 [Hyla sarda]